ncbi:MAG: hypothetical protein H7831_09655 [Magnetococcus sp. WYHC-3]
MDRDHQGDQAVERSWDGFPDPSQSNLLVWRRKEIENYFLDARWLQQSEYIKDEYKGRHGTEKLEEMLCQLGSQRLFLDLVNAVIVHVREGQKSTWVESFRNEADFPNAVTALDRLQNAPELAQRVEQVRQETAQEKLKELFDTKWQEYSHKQHPVQIGAGRWLEFISGKNIYRQLVNRCFKVVNRDRDPVTGRKAEVEIAKGLMLHDDQYFPPDFIELRGMMKKIAVA